MQRDTRRNRSQGARTLPRPLDGVLRFASAYILIQVVIQIVAHAFG
jgi:hypothetical protein